VTKRTVVVLALLLGLSFGLAFEPDSGTQAGVGPPDVHGLVLGANHAKPLPNVPSVADLLGLLGLGVATFLALALAAPVVGQAAPRAERDGDRHRSVFRSPARARRGPPAFA
jgi:hypothetical protein